MTIGADHELFRDNVRAFVAAEIAPHVNAWDEAGTFPRELYRRAAQLWDPLESTCRHASLSIL